MDSSLYRTAYFCISLLLFYYLLPTRLLTRIPFVILVGVAMYALLLSENIFNVGVDRTLPCIARPILFLISLRL